MKLALSLILSVFLLLWFVASVVGMVYVSRSAELLENYRRLSKRQKLAVSTVIESYSDRAAD